MEATLEVPTWQRTAALRAKMAAASPRLTRSVVADASGYSEGYVRNVLSDNVEGDVSAALDKLESAVDRLTGSPSPHTETEGAP